jgi:4-hydroxy-4-methyl-2-oxoglutarate aldolase
MNAPHSPDQLEALRRLDACTLANAIETFHVRLRNEGFAAGAVRCLFPRLRSMVGYAVTLKIRGASPPVSGAPTYIEHTAWWDYILSVPAPRIVVVEDVASERGRGALLGEVHVNILQALGCVGAVTNGAVRDVPAVEHLGFHFFAANLSVSHSYVHIVETGTPVHIDGLTVRSGDLLHGDMHGVQTVPHELVEQLPAAAGKISSRERALIALMHTPHLSLEKLRKAVAGDRSL